MQAGSGSRRIPHQRLGAGRLPLRRARLLAAVLLYTVSSQPSFHDGLKGKAWTKVAASPSCGQRRPVGSIVVAAGEPDVHKTPPSLRRFIICTARWRQPSAPQRGMPTRSLAGGPRPGRWKAGAAAVAAITGGSARPGVPRSSRAGAGASGRVASGGPRSVGPFLPSSRWSLSGQASGRGRPPSGPGRGLRSRDPGRGGCKPGRRRNKGRVAASRRTVTGILEGSNGPRGAAWRPTSVFHPLPAAPRSMPGRFQPPLEAREKETSRRG